MSNELFDCIDIETVLDDPNEVVTVLNECSDTSVKEPYPAHLKARQKLEVYWEQKRLEENLFDVLSDTRRIDTGIQSNMAGTSTLN